MTSNMAVCYAVNITTAVSLNGSYTKLAGMEKLVTLTCKVHNEGEPALAKNITLYYENLGNWTLVDASNNLSIADYGIGTYLISFTAETASEVVQVSAHVHDLRDILVQANTTCYET